MKAKLRLSVVVSGILLLLLFCDAAPNHSSEHVSASAPWPPSPSLSFSPSNSGPSSRSAPSLTPPNSDLLTLFHDMWHWRTQESPEFATQVGINDNTAGRLDSFSMQRFEKGKVHCEELLGRADSIDTSTLQFDDAIHLRIFKDLVQGYIENFKYFKLYFPVSCLEGPQLHLDHLVSRQMTLVSYNDFQKLLSRYGEFPRQTDEIIDLLKENIKNNIMPHNISMEGVLDQFSSLDVPVVDSPFFKPFLQLPLTFPPEQRRTLRQQATERIEQDIIPSFSRMRTFLQKEYLGKVRSSPSVNRLTSGTDYYTSLLHYYTSTVLTPQQIHSLGLMELRRLQEKVLEISIECGYSINATLSEILSDQREASKHYFRSKEDLLEALRAAIFHDIKPLLPKVVDNLPIDNLTVVGCSEDRLTRGMSAWYEAPSLDGTRPGVLHVDTQHLESIPQASIDPMSLHLSSPGHHLHAVFLQVSSSLPFFRKVLQTPRVSLAHLEFSPSPAFVEGWGLYSELRAEEMGIQGTPLQRLVRICRELATTSRLVIDTGIHALDWSLESATNFLLENTALSHYSIQNELKRIVTWPGLSCSAKVGEIRFKELRQKAENALGESFDILQFHRTLLQCTSPLNIVEDCVNHYVHEKINSLHSSIDTTTVAEPKGPRGEGNDGKGSVSNAGTWCSFKLYQGLQSVLGMWVIIGILGMFTNFDRWYVNVVYV